MERPHIRNPRGFGDVFAVLLSYIVFVTLLLQLTIGGSLRPVVGIGSALLLGWLVWAVSRILESEAIDPEEELEYRRQ